MPHSTAASFVRRTVKGPNLPLPPAAANDDGPAGVADPIVRAALSHFSAHGLSAAHDARRRAEAAFFTGDREAYRWWLETCRLLDGRIALEFDRQGLIAKIA